jgi:hypothetical protein
MISEWQVLDWLNRYDPSHLLPNQVLEVRALRSHNGPEKIFASGLNQLISYARASSDDMERAELLLNCGLLCFSHVQLLNVANLLEEAQRVYDRVDTHRQAIAEILLYIFYNSQEEHMKALLWARNARANLWKMVKYSVQQKDPSSEAWYKERMNELTSDLFQSPRYVYESIFDLQGSRLSAPAVIIKEKIEELLKDKKITEVHEKIKKLLVTVQGLSYEEKAEGWIYCGMVCAEIGNNENAIRYLKNAVAHYLPGSHEYLMARWILCLIRASSQPNSLAEIVRQMEDCIHTASLLKEKSDHQNQPVPYAWYTITGEAMRRVLKRTVATYA